MIVLRVLATAIAGLVLGACAESPPAYLDPPASTQPALQAPTVPVDTGAESSPAWAEGAIRIDPLASCHAGQVTTIHWTEAAVANGPIQLWIEDDPPGMFAKIGAAGSKQTGEWASPGQRFFVTDLSGRVLARLVVEAEVPCD